MKVTKTGAFCDFCVVGKPAITYTLPKGFVLMQVVDVETGKSKATLSNGLICACTDCAAIIAGPFPARLEKLCRRVFRTNPMLSDMPSGPKSRAKRAARKIWSSWLRSMTDPRPFVDGEDPLQGLHVEHSPGEAESN